MDLAIRYVDSKCITEKFISFIECEYLSEIHCKKLGYKSSNN